MNDLCRWVPQGAMSAAIERSSSARRCWDDENRLNSVLSPFCGQQKISRPSATSELARKRPKQRRFFVAGYAVTFRDCYRSPPIHPLTKRGFGVCVKIFPSLFLDIFSTINYSLNHECKFFTRYFSSEFFSRKFCNCASH